MNTITICAQCADCGRFSYWPRDGDWKTLITRGPHVTTIVPNGLCWRCERERRAASMANPKAVQS